MSLNPFCEIAVEEAIRLKERKIASEVVAGIMIVVISISFRIHHSFNMDVTFLIVTVGPKSSQEVLRTALAMGADRAIHVQSDLKLDLELQPKAVAETFEKLAKKEGKRSNPHHHSVLIFSILVILSINSSNEGDVDLIILGKQSIDGDNCATGPMLAAFLGWPQCTFAANLAFGKFNLTVNNFSF